jgi:hypothetical protein
VRAPGHAAWRTSVEAALGEQREVALAAGTPQSPGPDNTDGGRADSTGSSRRTLGWALGGFGVAGIATSLVTGALVIAKSSTVDDECTDKRCSPKGLDAAQSGRTLSTVSTVAAVAGAAMLGAGIYFVFSGDSNERRATLGLRQRRVRPRAQFGISSAPGGLSLQLRSSF